MSVVAAAALAAIAAWLLSTPHATTRLRAITTHGMSRPQPRGLHRIRRVIVARRGSRWAPGARDVVQVADLLSCLMAAGLDVTTSVRIVADSVPHPVSTTLSTVARAMSMGASEHNAWQSGAAEASWQPIAAAMARSARSGAPLANVLADTAEDLRREQVRTIEVAARAAGVRAVGPLAACFLPGYLLLGVVPVVAGLAESALQG